MATIVYKGDKGQRRDMQYDIREGRFNVLITTYEYVIRDKFLLSKVRVWMDDQLASASLVAPS